MALFKVLKLGNVRRKSSTKPLNGLILLSSFFTVIFTVIWDPTVPEPPVSGACPQWEPEVIGLFVWKLLPRVPTTLLPQKEIHFEKDLTKFGFGCV